MIIVMEEENMKKILLLFVLFFMGISNSLAVVEYDEDGNVVEYDDDEIRITEVEEIEPPDVMPPESEEREQEEVTIGIDTDLEEDEVEDDENDMRTVAIVMATIVVLAGGSILYFKRKSIS